MTRIKISIITPSLKNDTFLKKTIECVKRQSSDLINIEHIVIFDDLNINLPSPITLKNYKINFLKNNRNKGPSGARNVGLECAKGKFIFFIDADDLWPENFVSSILSLYSNLEINFVSVPGKTIGDYSGKLITPPLKDGFIPHSYLFWNAIGCPSGFSYRFSENLKKCRFNEKVNICEDFLFYLELYKKSNNSFFRYNKIYYFYRVHSVQSTRNINISLAENSIYYFKKDIRKIYSNSKNLRDRFVALYQCEHLIYKKIHKTSIFAFIILLFLATPYFFISVKKLLINKQNAN
jgi:teichuronic acid biosynthesis glycosyltransferase TuaG